METAPVSNRRAAILSGFPGAAARDRISVMITTRNRVEDLKRTCRVLQTLDPQPDEILITADGCSDGTVEFVRAELPGAKLIINNEGCGSVASRHRMMREASSELVLALDDDSYPEQPDCLARLAPLFAERPKLAVAHFPQRSDEYPDSLTRADFGPARMTRSFANSGACLRRSVYLELPGFEPRFFHMYEEPDYALQCVAAGYEVYYTPVVTVRHHYSSQTRSRIRNHHRHASNSILSALLRCPFPQVVGLVLRRAWSQFQFAWSQGMDWVLREPVWWWRAMAGIGYCLRRRRAVAWADYRRWRGLPDLARH